MLVGGAALDAGLRARALAAGVRVVTTYGMSETAGGCVYDGVPLDGVQVRLDADGGIRLGGPTLASGYLGRPDLTARAFTDGWFRTGDHGRFRDGRLEVLGRLDDMIITGGEKVAPAAVERVLLAQPGVRAACVVGLPDPEWGQVVAAAVVVDPTAAPIWTGCRTRCAPSSAARPPRAGCGRYPRSRCWESANRTARRSPNCWPGSTARPGDDAPYTIGLLTLR